MLDCLGKSIIGLYIGFNIFTLLNGGVAHLYLLGALGGAPYIILSQYNYQ